MYICIITQINSSHLFFFPSSLLMVISIGLKSIYSFLYRKHINHIDTFGFNLLTFNFCIEIYEGYGLQFSYSIWLVISVCWPLKNDLSSISSSDLKKLVICKLSVFLGGRELSDSCLQSRYSTTWATPPVHFAVVISEMGVSWTVSPTPAPAINIDPLDLSLSSYGYWVSHWCWLIPF
jgi:hypothetical protein